MKNENFEEFGNALAQSCIIHEKELSVKAVKAYFNTLKKYSIKEVVWAINKTNECCKWMPKPADIIDYIPQGRARDDNGKVVYA